MKTVFRLTLVLLLAGLLAFGMLACDDTEGDGGDTTPVVEPTRITLNKNTLSLPVTSNETLAVTITPATASQAVNWTSSVPTVATVSADGNVSALANGITIIFATTATGERTSCVVTVTDIFSPDGLIYKATENGLQVIGYNGTSSNVVIPSTYQNKPVVSISASAFKNKTQLTALTIPDSVTEIKTGAFFGCSGIEELTIPVTHLNTFPGKSYLRKITITGNGVLPENALSDLNRLNTVTLSNGITAIGTGAFADSAALTTVHFGNAVTTIGTAAFQGCTALTTITIPETVTAIGPAAFRYCHFLTQITLPSNLTKIDANTFYNCIGLTQITLPTSVTEIGESAFEGCTKLAITAIPNTVQKIGARAFAGCTDLTSMSIGAGVTQIDSFAFKGCTKLTAFSFGRAVSALGTNLFADCDALSTLTVADENTMYRSENNCVIAITTNTLVLGCKSSVIPSSVTIIGRKAFEDCVGLTTIAIPASVTEIHPFAFAGCEALASISFDPLIQLTQISEGAFQACVGLTSVVVPNTVTWIGSGAFAGCKELAEITIPFVGACLEPTGQHYPFGYIFGSSATGYTGCTATTQYYAFGSGTTNTQAIFQIPNKLRTVTVTGGKLVYGAFSNCQGITSFSYTGATVAIEDRVFEGCVNLRQFATTADVTKIGPAAFSKCERLTAISLSGPATQVDSRAFDSCTQLTSITLPANIQTIGFAAFQNCTSLTAYAVPSTVVTIDDAVFQGCTALQSLSIPAATTSIGEMLLDGCSALTAITVAPENTSYYGAENCIIATATNTLLYACNATTAIPSAVTAIASHAFAACDKMTTLTVPNTVTEIAEAAFFGCSDLVEITLPFVGKRATAADEFNQYPLGYIFGNTSFANSKSYYQRYHSSSLTNIKQSYFRLPAGLKTVTITGGYIPYGAFSGCNDLTTVSITSDAPVVGPYAFYDCKKLSSLSLPDTVTEIGSYAFQNCLSLTLIDLPTSLTAIRSYAFYNCSALTEITIPANVSTIQPYAFYGCASLDRVVFENGTGWVSNDIAQLFLPVDFTDPTTNAMMLSVNSYSGGMADMNFTRTTQTA